MHKFKKVEELIDILRKSDDSVTIEDIRETVLRLRHEKKIKLSEPAVQGSFFKYVSKTYYFALPLWLSLVAASLSLIIMFFLSDIEPFSTIRVIVGSVTTLLMPGYGLVGLIFPLREMSLIERIGLSIMLSLVIVLILWITLDQLHLGADINSVVSCMSVAAVLLITANTYQKFLTNKIYK